MLWLNIPCRYRLEPNCVWLPVLAKARLTMAVLPAVLLRLSYYGRLTMAVLLWLSYYARRRTLCVLVRLRRYVPWPACTYTTPVVHLLRLYLLLRPACRRGR